MYTTSSDGDHKSKKKSVTITFLNVKQCFVGFKKNKHSMCYL